MAVSIRPDIAMFRQEVRWVQNNQGYAYRGYDWSSGMTRQCDMVMCLSNGQKNGQEDLPCDSKEFKATSGLYPRN
jgi:hypothetical protein